MKKKKKNATKIHFPPWNSANYKYFFRSKFFILWIKGKTDLETSSHPNRKSHKNCYGHFQKKKLSSLRIFKVNCRHNDEDDDIFKPERLFPMFSILLWIKDVEQKIQIFEAFLLFPEFLKRRKITHTKYLIFDKTAKLKCEITLWGQTFARRKFCEVKQSWKFIGLTFTNDLLQLISQKKKKKKTFVIEEKTYFASNRLSRLVKTFFKKCLLLK